MASICKSLWRKIIGKPYSGKLNVRFDEGELEIEPFATTPALYSTDIDTKGIELVAWLFFAAFDNGFFPHITRRIKRRGLA